MAHGSARTSKVHRGGLLGLVAADLGPVEGSVSPGPAGGM